MNAVELPAVVREHPTIADHARQETERNFELLQQGGLLMGLLAGMALIVLSHILKKAS